MSNEVKLSKFPANKYEALSILFVEKQDLSGKTPEDVADMYADAYAKINAHFKEMRGDHNWLKE